jgi:four helix bundle protein
MRLIMDKKNLRADLEERLIDFTILIIEIAESLPKTRAGNTLSDQMVRSGTSVALNYGEVQDAESRKDFIHKIKIILKELRETLIALKIVYKTKMYKSKEKLEFALKENNELISIFVKSVSTARNNA